MKDLFLEIQKVVDSTSINDEEFSQYIHKLEKIESFVKLPGDASTRKYYRILTKDKKFILMRMDAFSDQIDNLPFIVMQSYLNKCGVDVPAVFFSDAERGLILLEDLGDVTFLRKLQGVDNRETEKHLYEQVIDSLVKLQVTSTQIAEKDKKKIQAFSLRFDHEKLFWEITHTIEHFYKIYLKRNIKDKDLNKIKTQFSEICQILADEPCVLTHRDFHSRNIMICSESNETIKQSKDFERFVMIDFQDARMGPIQYDLASLLKDSYYQLEESQIQFLIDYYIARYEGFSLEKNKKIDKNHFSFIFDLMSIQRNFKAIGSFASFWNRRGDPVYLKFIGNTFENIRKTLLKYPQYSALRENLFHYYYF